MTSNREKNGTEGDENMMTRLVESRFKIMGINGMQPEKNGAGFEEPMEPLALSLCFEKLAKL